MIQGESTIPSNDHRPNLNGTTRSVSTENRLVPLLKSIVVNPEKGKHIDRNVVAARYCNCFKYSLLSKDYKHLSLSLGITSANAGEGKTLVSSNLAVSLALGYQKKTVLVDLSMQRPRVHEVFGAATKPGLVEAFRDGAIQVSATVIDHLFVLSAGNNRTNAVGLHQLTPFRDVIYSLEQEFDFVIVDMPSMNARDFSPLLANQLNGLLVVVDARKTKRRDIDKLFHQLNERQILGFVLNRVNDHNF